jgi:hypothetical protein
MIYWSIDVFLRGLEGRSFKLGSDLRKKIREKKEEMKIEEELVLYRFRRSIPSTLLYTRMTSSQSTPSTRQ